MKGNIIMMDLADLNWRTYGGNNEFHAAQNAPIGTYVNLRTMTYYQQASDGTLPADIWHFIDPSSSKTASQIATIVNGVLGTSYTSSNFSAYASGNVQPYPGTGANDA